MNDENNLSFEFDTKFGYKNDGVERIKGQWLVRSYLSMTMKMYER